MSRLLPLLSWRSALCESDLPPTDRHVALTLALYMNERGGSAYPGSTRLAHDTGLCVRTVRGSLCHLVQTGWLTIIEQGGRKGEERRANEYEARIPNTRTPAAAAPVQEIPSTPAADARVPLQQLHPISSLNSPENSSISGFASDAETPQLFATKEEPKPKRAKNDARDPVVLSGLFEVLCEVEGIRTTGMLPRERGRIAQRAAELYDMPGGPPTPGEVRLRAIRCKELWGVKAVTAETICRRWGKLSPQPEKRDWMGNVIAP